MRKIRYKELLHWLSQSDPKKDENSFEITFCGVTVDTRHVAAGQLFFALPGARTDGHLFLEEAAKKGALGAVVNRGYTGSNFGLILISVEDVLQALQLIAQHFIEQSSAKIIAITGSLGKTTTKWFLYQLLHKKYKTATTSGSKNSQIGLSLAIINESSGDEEYFVLEMGMSQPGQLKKLVQIAPPDIAVITAIALVHAENFTTIEEIAEAKSEIFSHPDTQLAFLNRDTMCQDILYNRGSCVKKGYSLADITADFRLDCSNSHLQYFEKEELYVLPYIDFPASHLYNNLLVAIAVARQVGMEMQEIAELIPTITLPEKRLELLEKRGIHFINDSYNASELSMRVALDVLRKRESVGRKIAVLGHMRELGAFSEACHRKVGQHALLIVDELFCFGENCGPLVEEWKQAERPVRWFLHFEELFEAVQKTVQEGDVVLIKGARSLELERIIQRF